MLNFASSWPRRARVQRLATLIWVSLACSLVRADAASGTYTGSVALRGNYYWEHSTRVVAPTTSLNIDTPSGVRIDGTYLLDAITSASTATGTISDKAFTEKRNDVQAGLGYEFDFGGRQLDISARGRFSIEPDYVSKGAGFNAALSLDERNTVLRFNGYYVHDDVYQRIRMTTADDPNHLQVSSRMPKGVLDVVSMGLAWDQIINRQTTVTTGYDLSLLDGYQANAYRQVAFANGQGKPEKHPRERARSAGYVWLSYFSTATRTAFRGGYRLYYDNWNILAHTPEARIHQEIGPHLEIRLRYRYYTQDGAFFFRKGGNLNTDRFYTADPKMSAFHDQTLGFKVRLALDFLSFTKLSLLSQMVVDWNIEYVFNTNRYGNGLIAQGGIGFPF